MENNIEKENDKFTEEEQKKIDAINEDLRKLRNGDKNENILEAPSIEERKIVLEDEEPSEIISNVSNNEEKVIEEKSNPKSKEYFERRNYFKTLAEKEALEKENAELRANLINTIDTGKYYYDKNINSELDTIRNNLKRSYEEGDVEGVVQNQLDLTLLANRLTDFKKLEAEQARQHEQQQRLQQEQPLYDNAEVNRVRTQYWLRNNHAINPNHKNYDVKVANDMANFVQNLDADLAERGMGDRLYSDEYFDVLDKQLDTIKGQHKKVSSLESLNNVSPVRSSGVALENKNHGKIKLTPFQRSVAREANLTDEQYYERYNEIQSRRRR